jgi:hypothetical protein
MRRARRPLQKFLYYGNPTTVHMHSSWVILHSAGENK